jgi:hypothetical protein
VVQHTTFHQEFLKQFYCPDLDSAGEMWYAVPPEEQQKYRKQADEMKEAHYRNFPEWKWSSKEKRKQKLGKSSSGEEDVLLKTFSPKKEVFTDKDQEIHWNQDVREPQSNQLITSLQSPGVIISRNSNHGSPLYHSALESRSGQLAAKKSFSFEDSLGLTESDLLDAKQNRHRSSIHWENQAEFSGQNATVNHSAATQNISIENMSNPLLQLFSTLQRKPAEDSAIVTSKAFHSISELIKKEPCTSTPVSISNNFSSRKSSPRQININFLPAFSQTVNCVNYIQTSSPPSLVSSLDTLHPKTVPQHPPVIVQRPMQQQNIYMQQRSRNAEEEAQVTSSGLQLPLISTASFQDIMYSPTSSYTDLLAGPASFPGGVKHNANEEKPLLKRGYDDSHPEPQKSISISPAKKLALKYEESDTLRMSFEDEAQRICTADTQDTEQDPSSLISTSTTRQILDARRALVLQLFQEHGYYPPDNVTVAFQQQHSNLFANRFALQVKIREVRQNIMKKNPSPLKVSK